MGGITEGMCVLIIHVHGWRILEWQKITIPIFSDL